MTDKKKIKAEIERLKRDVYKSDAFNGQTRFALDRVTDFINSLPEEPKIDLKEESDIYNALAKFIGSFSKRDFDIAKHFYELGHTEEPVSEDLEDYINKLSKQFPEVSFAKLSRIAVRVAKWQKEQMMAKAIDGVITFDYYGIDDKPYGCVAHDSFCLEDKGLKDRDKVKLIIIKEE